MITLKTLTNTLINLKSLSLKNINKKYQNNLCIVFYKLLVNFFVIFFYSQLFQKKIIRRTIFKATNIYFITVFFNEYFKLSFRYAQN